MPKGANESKPSSEFAVTTTHECFIFLKPLSTRLDKTGQSALFPILDSLVDQPDMDRDVVFDMSAVTYVNGPTLRRLADVSFEMKGQGRTLKLLVPEENKKVHRVLEVIGFGQFCEIIGTTAEME